MSLISDWKWIIFGFSMGGIVIGSMIFFAVGLATFIILVRLDEIENKPRPEKK